MQHLKHQFFLYLTAVLPNVFSSKAIVMDEYNYFLNNSDKFNFTSQIFSFPLKWDLQSSETILSIISGKFFLFKAVLKDYFNQTLIFEK